MRRKLFSFICVLSLAGKPGLRAASVGTEGASFLDIPIGGRPAGLAGAYSSLATDAYAPVANPAGLGFLTNSQLAAMHLNSIESVSYEYASLVVPVTAGHSLGASVQYLSPGSTPQTDINGNPMGSFSGSFAAYSLAYGQKVGRDVSLGLAGKFIQGKIAGFSAQSYAADVGTLVQASKRLQLAGMVANIGKKMTYLDEGDSLPLSYRLGGSYSAGAGLLLALQGEYAKDGFANARAGVEWTVAKLVALRVGYRTETVKNNSNKAGVTAGVGIILAGQHFDYAWVPMADLGDSQYFSMVFQWGKPKQPKGASSATDTEEEERFNRRVDDDRRYLQPAEGSFPGTRRGGLHP